MTPINLTFKGLEYTIPANRAFEVGEAVERIVTLGEIGSWGAKVPFFTVARCVSVMLSFAGSKATKEDVFADMMADITAIGEGKATGVAAVQAVQALVACLMGGAPAGEADPDGDVKMPAS